MSSSDKKSLFDNSQHTLNTLIPPSYIKPAPVTNTLDRPLITGHTYDYSTSYLPIHDSRISKPFNKSFRIDANAIQLSPDNDNDNIREEDENERIVSNMFYLSNCIML